MDPQQAQQSAHEPSSPPGSPNVHEALRSIGEGLINLTGGKKESSWLPPAGWAWGLAPILFAALRVLVVSRGDAETLRALVQNLNVTALVLATVLPFGAVVSVVLTFSLFVGWKSPGNQPPKGQPFLLLLLIAVTGLLVVYAMPMSQIGAGIGVVAVIVFIVVCIRFIAVRAQATTSNGVPGKPVIVLVILSILGVLLAPFIYLIAGSGVWMPKERITVSGVVMAPVYVLSSDERWTTYMDDDHKIHVVPTHEISRREAVGSSRSWTSKSLWDNGSDAESALGRWLGSICR